MTPQFQPSQRGVMQTRKRPSALKTIGTALAVALLSSAVDGLAKAAQVCAWLAESNQPDGVRHLDLWLQSDADIDFLIKVDGDGILDSSGKSNSPESATYSLTAGQAEDASAGAWPLRLWRSALRWSSGRLLGGTAEHSVHRQADQDKPGPPPCHTSQYHQLPRSAAVLIWGCSRCRSRRGSR